MKERGREWWYEREREREGLEVRGEREHTAELTRSHELLAHATHKAAQNHRTPLTNSYAIHNSAQNASTAHGSYRTTINTQKHA